MGRFVNPDNSGFQTALNAEIYVDKTEIIGYTNRVLESTDAFICNSRPRRFGKSITADMLAAYYSKGRSHPQQAVDYTLRKYVKKAAGSPAGLVTYTHFKTLIIGLTPQDVAHIIKQAAK